MTLFISWVGVPWAITLPLERIIEESATAKTSEEAKASDGKSAKPADDKNKTAKFVRIPKFSEVPYPVIMEPNLVIEYYSR